MRRLFASLIVFLALTFADCLRATPMDEVIPAPVKGRIMCPAQIPTEQKLVRPVPGWEPFSEGSNAVRAISFYTGDPREGQVDVSEDDNRYSSPVSDGWILCGYEDTRVQLARPIATVTRCRVEHAQKDRYGVRRAKGAVCE